MADPHQLLDVDVDQLTRAGALVAVGRLGRPQTAQLAEADVGRLSESPWNFSGDPHLTITP
jgi:hypothetical protein